MLLNKMDLFGLELKTQIVTLPTGDVMIKEFTTAGREQFEMMAIKVQSGDTKNMKAKLIAISCINEDGNRLFGDDELQSISEMPSNVTEILFNAILQLNGMGTDAVGEAEGN